MACASLLEGEYYFFITPIGVVTPARVLIGQSDSVA
ncbi:hypothetical protein H310_07188 [Aphanomyces invadans]|uniref:Uncharacterized protein n=1 Tax=Aphanomyces invadans TaxID=157072 RepID=A0A024U3Y3_9STRA|nr:hypothetical protein H310_07188 [Aphanomyces invadans]ETW00617.1 hypothetical protein H310_07188 [Aphanomyces invadans]|eukprot:XP_008870752.1 hypothetical protein H310_07188 [Aphanomyces invadans]